MKRVIYLFLVFSIFLISCNDSKIVDPPAKQNEITIGVLVSLTGNWSSLGITTKSALEIAVDEINQNYMENDINLKFVLKVIDTKLDPELAYSATQELITDGVEIIIGPQSSAELSKIKPLLDANNIFAVSMSSTASSLALAGDHILRICPDDKPEGVAISALMWSKGIKKVIAVYRDDDGNIGLKRSMTKSFINLGGTVIDSIKYSNDDNITANLIDEIVTSLNTSTNASETAIYLAGFDEITDIFTIAKSNTQLSSTLWFGSNGSAMSSAIVSNADAASFANEVEFCTPLFALSAENETEWNSLFTAIEQATELKPDAYTFAAYDAIKIASLAYESSDNGFTNLFSNYVTISTTYNGLTGLTEFNSAGDRKFGNFTFFEICGINPNFSWVSVGSYNTSTNQLLYTGCN
ncbi:MAG: penicillin-binding protein activator [Bacteroidetes bacterium]|nr:penicillin-binding protein activator [Bacteroidota bacterium]MBU1113498.1 penicillin-binding protein activator [Bacteroidota bacterium]MBU1797389.1 penicillin-binding protein activator [Bacteroidota bacterium]